MLFPKFLSRAVFSFMSKVYRSEVFFPSYVSGHCKTEYEGTARKSTAALALDVSELHSGVMVMSFVT